MSRIELKHIEKFYGSNHVLKNINLVAEDGDFLTLLGPSGCGKTTTLRVVAGLEKPQDGQIFLDDKLIVNAKEQFFEEHGKRGMDLVFQSYALWPHMTVFDNVTFGLVVKKVPKAQIKEWAFGIKLSISWNIREKAESSLRWRQILTFPQ